LCVCVCVCACVCLCSIRYYYYHIPHISHTHIHTHSHIHTTRSKRYWKDDKYADEPDSDPEAGDTAAPEPVKRKELIGQ
jgi:hypothetical protein